MSVAAEIRNLYPPQDNAARHQLLERVRHTPLAPDEWPHLKWLYKQVEASDSYDVLGAVIARIDQAPLGGGDTCIGQVGAFQVALDEPQSTVAGDDVLAVSTRRTLYLFDLSSPLRPTLSGAWSFPNSELVTIKKHRLVGIVLNADGVPDQLQVLDISGEPTLIAGAALLCNSFEFVGAAGQLLVFLQDRKSIVCVDIGDTGLPRIVGFEMLNPSWTGISSAALIRSTLYVGLQDYVVFFDVKEDGFTRTGTFKAKHLRCVAACGERLAVVTSQYSWGNGTMSLAMYDTTNAQKPTSRFTTPVPRFRPGSICHRSVWSGSCLTIVSSENIASGTHRYDALEICDSAVRYRQLSAAAMPLEADTGMYRYQPVSSGLRIVCGAGPSPKTLAYMKRRARRCLRHLLRTNPSAFLETAFHTLRHATGRDYNLSDQWITAWLLYGDGGRLKQSRHGRGPCRLQPADVPMRYGEAKGTSKWSEQSDRVARLFLTPQLPTVVHQAMLLILYRRSRYYPRNLLCSPGILTSTTRFALLQDFLWGDSPYLIAEAQRSLNALPPESLDRIPPSLLAGWFFYSAGRFRSGVQERLLREASSRIDATGVAVLRLIQAHCAAGAITNSRRLEVAARFVVSHCSAAVFQHMSASTIPLLVQSPLPSLQALAYAAIRRLAAVDVPGFLTAAAELSEVSWRSAVAALQAHVATSPLSVRAYEKLVNSDLPRVRHAGWRLALAGNHGDDIYLSLWRPLLFSARMSTALIEAVQCREAMMILAQIQTALRPFHPLDRVIAIIRQLNDDQAENAWKHVKVMVRDTAFTFRQGRKYVEHPDAFMRVAGWRLIHGSATAPDVVAQLFDCLFRQNMKDTRYRHIIRDPIVLELLRTVNDGHFLGVLFRERSDLLSVLPQDVLADIIGSVGTHELVTAARDVDSTCWQVLRPVYLECLDRRWNAIGFWRDMEAVLSDDPEGSLHSRIVDDADFSRRFVAIDSDQVLKLRHVLLEPLMLRWIDVNHKRFERGSVMLLAASTHRLPGIRRWALARLDNDALDLPFALKLLESELPEPAAVAQRWFDNIPPGTAAACDAFYALTDSSVAGVQRYGRALLERLFPDRTGDGAVFERLAEHPDQDMQYFVARKFEAAPDWAVSSFDRSVLRRRRYARQAKESVKARWQAASSETPVDIDVLKELARGRNQRDREWAWARLAALASAGVEIEGMEITYGNHPEL